MSLLFTPSITHTNTSYITLYISTKHYISLYNLITLYITIYRTLYAHYSSDVLQSQVKVLDIFDIMVHLLQKVCLFQGLQDMSGGSSNVPGTSTGAGSGSVCDVNTKCIEPHLMPVPVLPVSDMKSSMIVEILKYLYALIGNHGKCI